MAEDSRERRQLPGYNSIGAIPGNGKKLIERARAGQGQAILPEMFRTRPEKLVGPTGERNVHSQSQVTRGLGLDPVDEQRVQSMIDEFDPSFTPKSGQQRSFMIVARLTEALRRSFKHIPADVRMEIVTRARSYWRNKFPIDNTREPVRRYGQRSGESMAKTMFVVSARGDRLSDDALRKAVAPPDHDDEERPKRDASGVRPKPQGMTQAPPKSGPTQGPPAARAAAPTGAGGAGASKPPPGFTPVPNSKVGAYHKREGDGFIYWRPGQGVTRQNPDAAGQPQPGAQKPQGAPQKPGAAPAGAGGPPGAPKPAAGPQKPGAKGAAGPGGPGDLAPQFKPHADGMGDHDALHHHVSAREQHKAAARKHATKDPKRAAAHRKAQDQHTKAANDIIRRVGKEDPDKVRQVVDRARGKKTGDDSQQFDPNAEPQTSLPPEMGGEEPPPFEGASDPDQAAADGYGRSPAGVRMGADGSRETAASSRTRTVPESQTVRAAREALGRAMNIMGDLSAAHDQLGGLEAAREKVAAMPRGDRKRKHMLAQLDAEIAATKYDIVQLEGAHSHAMNEVAQVQMQMRAEQIEAHPIFKMFMLVMQKLQQFADAVADRVEEIQRNLSPEERERKKTAEIFAEAVKQMKGGDGPENILGIGKEEINALFGYDENSAKRNEEANAALDRLDAQMDGPDEVSDASEADDALGEAIQTSQGALDAKGKAKQKREESDAFDRDIANSRAKRDDAEKKAGAQAALWEQRNSGRSARSVMKEQLGGDDAADSKAPTRDGKTSASGVRPKRGAPVDSEAGTIAAPKKRKLTPEESGTIASKPGKKAIKKSMYMTHTRAFAWALRAAHRAHEQMRKAEAANHVYVAPRMPRRHVPFFFNELGG